MYYACTLDKWDGSLITADPCDTMEEAQSFIADVLHDIWPHTQTAAILTEGEYRELKERL
jgi:hypothetical protein